MNRVIPDPDVLLCETCSHQADCEITDQQKGQTCHVYVPIAGISVSGLGKTEVIERVIGDERDVNLCETCERFDTEDCHWSTGTSLRTKSCSDYWPTTASSQIEDQPQTPDEILRQYQEFFARSLQDLSFELGKHNLAVGELQITRQDHQSPYGHGTALDSQTFFALITTFSRGKNRMPGDE